ncbi:MAG: peroxiredoxin family protein [Candidatus Omnitrophota bacterium]
MQINYAQAGSMIPKSGEDAPDFSLKDFSGKEFTLSTELRDKKAVLLWFTNLCQGCQLKLPEMEKIKNIYDEKGIEVVAVSVLGEDEKTVENIIRKKRLTLRFLYDPINMVTDSFGGGHSIGVCPLRNLFLIGKDRKTLYIGRYPGAEESEILYQLNKVLET